MSDNCLQMVLLSHAVLLDGRVPQTSIDTVYNRCADEPRSPLFSISRATYFFAWLISVHDTTTNIAQVVHAFHNAGGKCDHQGVESIVDFARDVNIDLKQCTIKSCPFYLNAIAQLFAVPLETTHKIYVPVSADEVKSHPASFGRYELDVKLHLSCTSMTLDDINCGKLPNCTKFIVEGSIQGKNDFDIAPPRGLKHTATSPIPHISCLASDILGLGFLGKLFHLAQTGKWVEYYIGARVALTKSDMRVVNKKTLTFGPTNVNGLCNNAPSITIYEDGPRTWVAGDSVYHDEVMYGDILNHTNTPPTITNVHHNAYESQIEVWGFQLDADDLTLVDYPATTLTSSHCYAKTHVRPIANCSHISFSFTGAYWRGIPQYLAVADKGCVTFLSDGSHKAWYLLGPKPTVIGFVLPTISVDGRATHLPPAPIKSTDWFDHASRVATGTDIFSLIVSLVGFITNIFTLGPGFMLGSLVNHWVDILSALGLYFALRRGDRRTILACLFYWTVRLYAQRRDLLSV